MTSPRSGDSGDGNTDVHRSEQLCGAYQQRQPQREALRRSAIQELPKFPWLLSRRSLAQGRASCVSTPGQYHQALPAALLLPPAAGPGRTVISDL